MNAIELLKQDHAKVRKLLEQLETTTPRGEKTRRELLEKIHLELKVHTTIEEEIFYPAFREAASTEKDKEMIAEAFEEHRAVDKLVLPDLLKTDVDTIAFGGRAKVLKEMVEHHADEEEKEMFKAAKRLFTKEELENLGETMEARKKELLKQRAAA